MKNLKKIAAAIAAAAMAMSMGVSAFAEVVEPTISADKATLTININNADEAQMTMMAYVVEGTDWTTANAPAYTDQEIVALDQEAGSKGFTTVPVDPAKLADGNSIIVKIGASSGDLATYVIKMAKQIVTYSVTYELAGGAVTNPGASTFTETDTIAAFFAELEAPVKVGYTFAGWTDESGAAVDTASKALMSTLDANADKTVALTATYEQVAGSDPVVVVYGDVDGNGIVDTIDATWVLRRALSDSIELPVPDAANVTKGDAVIDTIDATWVLRKALSDSVVFPIEE